MTVFDLPPTHVHEVFALISQSSIGIKVLNQFEIQCKTKKVTFDPYPLNLIEKLKNTIGPDQPIGACFVTDGDQGAIHYDPTSPLGILAPFIFHEIVHSLDPALWHAARTPQTRHARDRAMLQAETQAFDSQHRLIGELSAYVPGYRDFMNRQYPRARILHERLTETDISDLYGFKIA